MDIMKPTAVIGTNAWGGKLYGKVMRGSYVEDEVIRDAMKTAKEQDIFLSAKYTPFTHYKPGCVRKSLVKDLRDFRRDYVDIYWLHLPTDIDEHLREIAVLYREGKIRLTKGEVRRLEEAADKVNVKIMESDLFRPFVLKERRSK